MCKTKENNKMVTKESGHNPTSTHYNMNLPMVKKKKSKKLINANKHIASLCYTRDLPSSPPPFLVRVVFFHTRHFSLFTFFFFFFRWLNMRGLGSSFKKKTTPLPPFFIFKTVCFCPVYKPSIHPLLLWIFFSPPFCVSFFSSFLFPPSLNRVMRIFLFFFSWLFGLHWTVEGEGVEREKKM